MTFAQVWFLQNTSNPSILAHLPMTNAVIRAMDTIEDFALKNSLAKIKKFILAGESKRGWITWLSTAVDPKRVYSAVPVVLDFLDINKLIFRIIRIKLGYKEAHYPLE
ncbi:autocrine proliferation repressor A-like [Brachionus plicatilis]|uniref:Autocrine proliferation repressor A-like n=1 Tax=Brachionus plicatilis TaxID=10195 RepID=A0A3M7R2W3_BRAPC|nr:autocrine proliferation repressor A-like [Brachionus plicatilis]